MQHSFWSLSSLWLLAACAHASVTGCSQRWRQEEALASLYLQLSSWERDGEKRSHNFYEVSTTFMLLARGASFARLPTEQEEAEMHEGVRLRLAQAMASLGGYPERCGICVAATDTSTLGVESHFRFGSQARNAAMDARVATHVQQRLPPGKYCHSLALDRRPWDNLHVSPFEIQEHFARDVIEGRSVLVLRGPANGPSDEQLARPLRFAGRVAVLPVEASGLGDGLDIDSLVAELGALLKGIDLLLLVGLPTGVGALLAMEVTCTHHVQALDAGELSLTAEAGTLPPAPLQTAGPQATASVAGPEPRPQLLRPAADWQDLNGEWELHISTDDATIESLPRPFPRSISVPFPPQSHKGLATKVSASEAVWYRRRLHLPPDWCDKVAAVTLHVDACDWECAVYLDGSPLGVHRGGYDPFSLRLDVSSGAACSAPGVELLVRAWDPTDAGCVFNDNPPIPCEGCCETGWQPRGKQSLKPGSIMYTAVTGIWRQGVWIERTALCHVQEVSVIVHTAATAVSVEVATTCGSHLGVEIRGVGGEAIGKALGPCCTLQVQLSESLHAWSPEAPHLYEAIIGLDSGRDVVVRRFARRSIAIQSKQILLNGKAVFMHGTLYQGYWPESLLTPPDAGAVERDLRAIKAAGFNTVRVHAVVMGAIFYALCDELGLFVWQDMPAGDMRAMPTWAGNRGEAEDDIMAEAQRLGMRVGRSMFDEIRRTPASAEAFRKELHAMLAWLAPFQSIVVWVAFNEGWGQSETGAIVDLIRKADPSRLVDAASGWNEVEGAALGDFADVHNYEDNSSAFGPLPETFIRLAQLGFAPKERALALGEYGGLGYAIEGHEWSKHGAWGYGEKTVNRNVDVFATALENLLGRLLPLLCDGLGAAIYTQWNDVETEVNGLVTYDRHMKLPLEALQRFSEQVLLTAGQCSKARAGAGHVDSGQQ